MKYGEMGLWVGCEQVKGKYPKVEVVRFVGRKLEVVHRILGGGAMIGSFEDDEAYAERNYREQQER